MDLDIPEIHLEASVQTKCLLMIHPVKGETIMTIEIIRLAEAIEDISSKETEIR